MVKTMVEKTVSFLIKKKTSKFDGPWMKKLDTIATECQIETTKMDNFDMTVREPFLTELVDNIEIRYLCKHVIY